MWGLLYPQPYFAGGRRTEICWSMGTKTFAVFERIPPVSYTHLDVYKRQVYNKAETLIMEYNEELRAWKNQAEQKKENPLEQRKKASVLEKLHRYQQEGRQQPKRSVKKKSMDRER